MDPFPQHECKVSGALGYVLRVSQIFGVASLKFKSMQDGWRIRVSRAASLYGKNLILLLCLLATVSLVWDICLKEASIHSRTASSTVLSVATLSLTSGVLFAEVSFGMRRKHNLITSIASIQKINLELNNYVQFKSYERKQRVMALLSIVGGSIIVILDYGILFYDVVIRHANFIKEGLYMAYFVEIIILKILTVQLALIFISVLISFNHLNDCLQNLLELMHSVGTVGESPKSVAVKVGRLGFLYSCLCDVIRHTNDNHGIVLVPLMLSFLVNLIMTPYSFITSMFGNTAEFYKSVLQVLWVIYYVVDLLIIVEPCHRTYKQMERTKLLVSRLMHVAPPADYALLSELDGFYHHLTYNRVVYAPMKVFTIKRGLITTMLGSIITYLVVVIQY